MFFFHRVALFVFSRKHFFGGGEVVLELLKKRGAPGNNCYASVPYMACATR